MTRPGPSTLRRDVLAVVVLALAARLAFRIEIRLDPLFSILAIDARFYLEMGRRFAAGDLFFGPEPLWFAPLYPALLGLVFRLFGEQPTIIVWAQHALGIGTAIVGVLLGARSSPAAGRVAGGLLALTPVVIFYENQLLYASMATATVALFLLAFVRARSSGTLGAAVLAGAALGLAALLRTNVLLFAPVGAVLLFVNRRGVRSVAGFAGGVALVLVFFLLRNGIVSGVWTPLTVNGGMILATGFAEDARGGRALTRTPWDFGPHGAYQREAEAALGRELTLAEASDWQRERAVRSIRDDPARAFGLTASKVALFLNVREIDDNLSFPLLAERSRVLSLWPAPWVFFLLPGVIGAVLAFRRKDTAAGEVRVYAWFALIWALSLLPFFMTARYRLPTVVPLAVLAGYATNEIVRALRIGRRREVGIVAAAALVVLGPLAFRDPGVRADPGYEWNAVGGALQDAGRSAEALAALDRAIAVRPGLAGAHVNRSLALADLGRTEEAIAEAAEATRLDPELPAAWRTFGALTAQAGRVEEALPAFRRAVELAPADPTCLRNLAQALAYTGQLEEAIVTGRRAVAVGARDLGPAIAAWEQAVTSSEE